MKKISTTVCWICNKHYSRDDDAVKCEKKGLTLPFFKIGDTVKYQVSLGADREGLGYYEDRAGVVMDILFPLVPKGRGLLHTYSVSYLIRMEEETDDEEPDEEGFFEEDLILSPSRLDNMEVVDEMEMYFKDGEYIRSENSRRTIVTSWNDYVAGIAKRNVALKSRLKRFTAELRRRGCLD